MEFDNAHDQLISAIYVGVICYSWYILEVQAIFCPNMNWNTSHVSRLGTSCLFLLGLAPYILMSFYYSKYIQSWLTAFFFLNRHGRWHPATISDPTANTQGYGIRYTRASSWIELAAFWIKKVTTDSCFLDSLTRRFTSSGVSALRNANKVSTKPGNVFPAYASRELGANATFLEHEQ